MNMPTWKGSRIEKFLAKLTGQNVEVENPQSRVEEYLKWILENGTAAEQAILAQLPFKADLVGGIVPTHQLPSYVSTIVEVDTYDDLPRPGSGETIYVVLDQNRAKYRWGGTDYIPVGDEKAYYAVAIPNMTTMGELRTYINGINEQGLHVLLDMHNFIADAYVCTAHVFTKNNVQYCEIFDVLNSQYIFKSTGYVDSDLISEYVTHAEDVIVTSALVEALSAKMDKVNPTGSGYMTIGTRASGSTAGDMSLVVGDNNVASKPASVALGHEVTASGQASFVQGAFGVASGNFSFAQGTRITSAYPPPTASGLASVAVGESVQATGRTSIAIGYNTEASGQAAKSSGYKTKANGTVSSSNGGFTEAIGFASITNGWFTKAAGDYQHAFGVANVEDSDSHYIEVVGNGDATQQEGVIEASNARTLDWNGNERLHGDVYVNCNDDSSGGSKVATETHVAQQIAAQPTFTMQIHYTDGTTKTATIKGTVA